MDLLFAQDPNFVYETVKQELKSRFLGCTVHTSSFIKNYSCRIEIFYIKALKIRLVYTTQLIVNVCSSTQLRQVGENIHHMSRKLCSFYWGDIILSQHPNGKVLGQRLVRCCTANLMMWLKTTFSYLYQSQVFQVTINEQQLGGLKGECQTLDGNL